LEKFLRKKQKISLFGKKWQKFLVFHSFSAFMQKIAEYIRLKIPLHQNRCKNPPAKNSLIKIFPKFSKKTKKKKKPKNFSLHPIFD
jgi:hypothetical protein